MAPAPATFIAKIKVQLKLAIARLRMVQQRDEALNKTQRRSMAQLLDAGKYDSARIRVENIIRGDIITELHELLELYCELLYARAGLLEASSCDPGLEEAIKSIIYAAPKTEIKELVAVRSMLADKYGKEFVLQAMDNSDSKVSPKVIKKLSVTPPREELVDGYLEEIATAYGIDWPKHEEQYQPAKVPENLIDPDYLLREDEGDVKEDGLGRLKQALIPATPAVSSPSMKDLMGLDGKEDEDEDELPEGSKDTYTGGTEEDKTKKPKPVVINPPSPSTENIHPRVTLNRVELKPSKRIVDAGMTKKKKTEVEDLDNLAKRFAALKKP